MKHIAIYLIATTMALLTSSAWASGATIPHTFASGSPARASEVNGNFSAVKKAVDDNDARLTALEQSFANLQTSLADANDTISTLQSKLDTANATITTLQSQMSAVNNSNVMALDPYVSVSHDSRGPIATFSSINLQLVNGTGTTDGTPNGLGNLIIGYDLARTGNTYICSDGAYTDQSSCEGAGDTVAVSLKTGSHNLVIGDENNYSQYGGLVVGFQNTINRAYASVSGGTVNTASGLYASVSGGADNTASGNAASVSGGQVNTASEGYASVSGGSINKASGPYASVSGGSYNTASGINSSVSGGGNGIGGGNTASMNYSSILGGVSQTTTSYFQTIPALP
jgi:uncharacterized coiled-coil protein SlyX